MEMLCSNQLPVTVESLLQSNKNSGEDHMTEKNSTSILWVKFSLSYSFPNLYRYTRVNPLCNHHVPLTIMIVCFFRFGKLEPLYHLIELCRGRDKMAGWEAGQYTNQVKASRMVEGGEDVVWSCSCL